MDRIYIHKLFFTKAKWNESSNSNGRSSKNYGTYFSTHLIEALTCLGNLFVPLVMPNWVTLLHHIQQIQHYLLLDPFTLLAVHMLLWPNSIIKSFLFLLYYMGNIYLIVIHVKEVGSVCKMYRDINVVHPLMQWKLLVQHGKKRQQVQGMCVTFSTAYWNLNHHCMEEEPWYFSLFPYKMQLSQEME